MRSNSVSKKVCPRIKLRPFTAQSYKDIDARIKAQKEEALKRLIEKERRVRNRTRGGKEKKKDPNPYLAQGKTLPSNFYVSPELFGKPVEDIDDFYRDKYTFIAVNRSKVIYRFSCKNALFVFSPTNPIREKFIFISTHPYFIWLMMLIILTNAVLITAKFLTADSKVDIVFLIIYSAEIVLRMVARGVIIDHFSYARDLWLLFDLVVATFGWLLYFVNIGNVRGFQVFRIFKMIVVIPGFRVIVFAFWKAVCHLRDIAIITFFIFSIYALLGYQLFREVLRMRCIPVNITRLYNQTLQTYLENTENISVVNDWELCRQGSCGVGFDCKDVRRNPDGDAKSFDNFWWSMLSVFRIVTQDHWEKLYNQVMRSFGPLCVFYFLSVMFIGTYFVLNLILGIVSMAFEEAQCQENLDERNRLMDEELERRRREEELEQSGKEAGGGETRHDGSLPSLLSIAKSTESKDQRREEITGLKGLVFWIRSHLVQVCSRRCCPPCWRRISTAIEIFITDPFMEFVLALCIALNTVIMALESDDEDLNTQLESWEKGFAILFIVEAALKCLGLGFLRYFGDKWNRFDAIVVLICIVDLIFGGLSAVTILRSLRLLRVIKLAKSWRTLQRLLQIIRHTFKDLANLSVVLAMVIFIFASLGGQLFGSRCEPGDCSSSTRWHFCDFVHSLLMVFRILCGEWIEPMWQCFACNGEAIYRCLVFYLVVVIVGNLFGLSLFLALLLNSFNAESLMGSQEDEDSTKLQEAIDRIHRWCNYFSVHAKRHLAIICKRHSRPSRQGAPQETLEVTEKESTQPTLELRHKTQEALRLNDLDLRCHDDTTSDPKEVNVTSSEAAAQIQRNFTGNELVLVKQEDKQEQRRVLPTSCFSSRSRHVRIIIGTVPADCLPKCGTGNNCRVAWVMHSGIGERWSLVRAYALQVVEHIFFQVFIVFLIVLSSVLLTLEDINMKEGSELSRLLKLTDVIFAVIFSMEMVVMWLAYGMKSYFTNGWCLLDFMVVMISCQQAFWPDNPNDQFDEQYESLKSLRTLRALRPLRVISKWEGMKLVVNALFQAIPSIFNVLLVCLLFWLLFAIAGVQLFRGRLGTCNAYNETIGVCSENWEPNDVNFDDVINAYLALFQVATFEGWIEIMEGAADRNQRRGIEEFEVRMASFLYFIVFIILGSFLILNLFVGVLIDSVNELKRRAEGSLEFLMTESQKKYYKTMKRFSLRKPGNPVPKPSTTFQLFFYRLVRSAAFEASVLLLIFISSLVMIAETHFEMADAMSVVNFFFVIVFFLEFILKLIGLRCYYFRDPWNIVDFVTIVLSVIEISVEMQRLDGQVDAISPRIFRSIRLLRTGRSLRLIKAAKGIRVTFFFSLIWSLPALFNIALLLFLVMFIYSIVGMFLFMRTEHSQGVNEIVNFETFRGSMLLLIQASTAAGWDELLGGLRAGQRSCRQDGERGCGNDRLVAPFLVSYIVITFLVIINLYVAVILEYFNQATTEVKQGLTNDDQEMFYETWEQYDDLGNQYIHTDQLGEFVNRLEAPLRLPLPNRVQLVLLDIPIYKGDLVYCVDVLEALIKHFFGTTAREAEELGDLKRPKRTTIERESSTLTRQRESYSATIIQRAWRRWRGEATNRDKKADIQTATKTLLKKSRASEKRSGK